MRVSWSNIEIKRSEEEGPGMFHADLNSQQHLHTILSLSLCWLTFASA